LWSSIYANVAPRLLDKLAEYHPDLPVFIMEAEYGQLFSDPSGDLPVDRALMSLVAIASLRSQEGGASLSYLPRLGCSCGGTVGPQVMSHVLGLKRAPNAGWIQTDEGVEWALGVVEELSNTLKQAKVLAKL
jgi:hypothetical protein